MQPANAPSEPNKGQKHGPYEGTLRVAVNRLQDEPFLFVIAIAILLVGLAILASVRGTLDLRFIATTTAIAILALIVIIGYFIVKLVRVEKQQVRQQSELGQVEEQQVHQKSEIDAIRIALKLDQVEERQDLQQSEINAIRLALRGILTKHEFSLLKGLYGTGKCEINKRPDLLNYLYRLDGLDFIQPNSGYGFYNIDVIPNDVIFDLKDYFHLTHEGTLYLDLLTDLGIYKSVVDWRDPYPWTPLPPSR